jgi:hypothetical protein
VLIKFNINGVSNLGADGFAFWLVREVEVLGKFFGFVEKFHGIGVVIDTYDNDGTGMHPMISVLQNNGDKEYEHEHKGGEHHGGDMELGHCSYPVRNLKTNSYLRITYNQKTLTVSVKRESETEWTTCMQSNNVDIEPGLYMGLSAATGHLADNHDILGVAVRNLEDDAKYFDSEARFAQFSKYSISESLGRIQADIRGALLSMVNQKPVASVAAPTTQASVSDETLSNELSQLRTELTNVISSLQKASTTTRGTQQQPDFTKDFREIQNSLKSGVNDLSSETQKLSALQTKLDSLIRDSRPRPERTVTRDQDDGGLFTLMNFLFLVVCAVALYFAVLYYRVKPRSSGTHKLV